MDTNSHSGSSSLFIADVPPHLEEPEFIACFQNLEGFLRARLRRDRNNKYAVPLIFYSILLNSISAVVLVSWIFMITSLLPVLWSASKVTSSTVCRKKE